MKKKGPNEKITLLKKVDVFSQFADDELEVISRYSEYRGYSRGDEIFREGSRGTELFVVSKGQVLITVKTEGEKQRDVARYLPGESFGELSLFEESPRTATATAEDETSLLVFPMEGITFTGILEKHAYISAQMLHKLLAMISGRIRRTNSLISERTQWVQELRKQILNDKLTGLYNRTFLEEEFVTRLPEFGERVSVLALKPDNFKAINDTCGHDAGDRVLRMLADAVRNKISSGDIPVRYRGDEFMVILPEQAAEQAMKKAESLNVSLQKVDTSQATGGKHIPITVSMGIAQFPDDAGDGRKLLESAFSKMWEARESGGDRIAR